MVEPYVPKPSLVAFHSTARVVGGNEFTLEGIDSISMDSPFVLYAIGVAVPAAVMLVFYLSWILALCFQRCCKRVCCAKCQDIQTDSNQVSSFG
jgi:hypothetical protein